MKLPLSLRLAEIAAAASHVKTDLLIRHKAVNETAWIQYRRRYSDTPYIEHQNAMESFAYGKHHNFFSFLLFKGKPLTGARNDCEVIAAYNLQIALEGKAEEDFPGLLYRFEKNGILLDGYFGTALTPLIRYLHERGYQTELLKGRKITPASAEALSASCRAFIIMTWNDRRHIMQGIHTMCVSKENGRYSLHNDYEGTRSYPTLYDCVRGYNQGKSRPIWLVGVR